MYNVKKVITKPKFNISVQIYSAQEKLSRRRSCRSQTLKVCTSYVGKGKESNMAIIDVKMVSGFTADEEQFDEVHTFFHGTEIETGSGLNDPIFQRHAKSVSVLEQI